MKTVLLIPMAWLCALLLVSCGGSRVPESDESPRSCAGGERITGELDGAVTAEQLKTYLQLPIEVPAGASRLTVGYSWADNPGPPSTPLTQTVLDLGIWDADGLRVPEGFRGWSGSRQGRLHAGQEPVHISAQSAERGYLPGPLEAGTWHVELGVAALAPQAATWAVEYAIECGAGGQAPTPDPVDAEYVAAPGAAWYHGDFHMHGVHSNPEAPEADEIVAMAREAQLDFLMITDYVTSRHWSEWGATQRANPDLLIWPGREIITYFGHANTHGETPSVIEYRHGFEDVTLGDIQRQAKAAGALFQVNHPTIFPGPLFSNFCRGCAFELADEIDWAAVDTIEVLTGPILATGDDIGAPIPGQAQNPFVQTAIDYWEERIDAGFFIAPVSGSDSKGVEPDEAERERAGYGSSATAVFAEELSRDGLRRALAAGRSYVRTRGVARSPALEFTARAADGAEVMFGGSLAADSATLRAEISGGAGQVLRYLVNGLPLVEIPVTADPFVHEFPAFRMPDEGPLGTYWRIETFDAESLTTIGGPIFLAGASG